MAESKKYFGVYLPDGDGHPVALFDDADAAQRYRLSQHGATGMVAEVEASIQRNATVADHFEATAEPAAAAAAPPDPDAVLRGEIRSQLEMEARRERVTGEVRREMASESSQERPAVQSRRESQQAAEGRAEAERLSADPERAARGR